MAVRRVALLTAGGFAPCLSSAVGGLIERYTEVAPDVEIIAYQHGYHGLLTGTKIVVDAEGRAKAGILHKFGGSPIGNSRVKLTNAVDCVKRGLVKEGENPLRVAAERLAKDGITILHTIGGDDTNTTAADLAAYLGANRSALCRELSRLRAEGWIDCCRDSVRLINTAALAKSAAAENRSGEK